MLAGLPLPIATDRDAARFWRRVKKSSMRACWPWQGGRLQDGYGMFSMRRASGHYDPVRAHRAAWLFSDGDPSPLLVLHSCDNPLCCNPAHLFLGTQRDNMRDKHRKGRADDRRGELSATSKLTHAQAVAIKSALRDGVPAAQLASAYSMSRRAITDIGAGRRWKHI